MSPTASDTPESGQLPGRFEFVPENTRGEPPTDPDFQLFSDVVRSWEMDPGASVGRQDAAGSADAQDHFRGGEEPSASVGYDMQRFPVDGSGNPQDASGYGILRDQYNRLHATLTLLRRRESPGGNDDAGVREFGVVTGAAVDTVTATLDPTSNLPILLELDFTPQRARSYLVHQPSASTTLEITSTDSNDTMDITIEDEDASTTETISLSGTTAVTTTSSFGDIDAVWLDSAPTGDVTITDGSGTTLVELTGGNSYSEDGQPLDGDRGIPPLGSGSRGAEIGTSFEHFEGDRFERPVGSSIRPRVNSGSWTVENDVSQNAAKVGTRAPAVDEGNRTVTVDADVAGEFVSHRSMMDTLQKNQETLEHELSGGTITFSNTVPQETSSRTVENDQGAASYSETFGCSGDPPISLSAN